MSAGRRRCRRAASDYGGANRIAPEARLRTGTAAPFSFA
jgi:ribosomal protein L44E